MDVISKVLVDTLPNTGAECPFGELIEMTSKIKCRFQRGLHSRCNLDCGMECCYLMAPDEKEEN